MSTYKTQIQWGGPSGDWHDAADLVIEIKNRPEPKSLRETSTIYKEVVPATGAPSKGTQVSWAGPNGNGNITFFNEGTSFTGSAQFPGEGPVGYRGQLKG